MLLSSERFSGMREALGPIFNFFHPPSKPLEDTTHNPQISKPFYLVSY